MKIDSMAAPGNNYTRSFFQKKLKETTYSFFRKELSDALYDLGDVYNGKKVIEAQETWNIASKGPYLNHIKTISQTWPHLRLLADFMEVSTTPLRWSGLNSKEKKVTEEREERARRTNVTRLDYLASGEIVQRKYTTSDDLRSALKLTEEHQAAQHTIEIYPWLHNTTTMMQNSSTGVWEDTGPRFRLYIVEDLSRDVIEAFGDKFDIDPAFFREQILDYVWCNIRDRWWDPPHLEMAKKEQGWMPLRFVTARYFKNAQVFLQACDEAANSNVFRRPDDDLNNRSIWDDDKAIVGISRQRASLWMRSSKGIARKKAIGILLVDPTIKAGSPLWYGYRNWEPTPSHKTAQIPPPPSRISLYSDLIHWAKRPDMFSTSSTCNAHLPISALLHIICAEWLTMAEYIKTRLSQIEWEISVPEHFLKPGTEINDALKKLHMWRRLVPLYREMLAETIERVEKLDWPTDHTGIHISATDSFGPSITPISMFGPDFRKALSYMQGFQEQIDRLSSVVTAVISIEDSRHAQSDNRNLARLTWLGTFFIPLSYIASLFSMQSDIGSLIATYRLYFAVALPSALAAVCLLLALPKIQVWVIRSWELELAKRKKKNK